MKSVSASFVGIALLSMTLFAFTTVLATSRAHADSLTDVEADFASGEWKGATERDLSDYVPTSCEDFDNPEGWQSSSGAAIVESHETLLIRMQPGSPAQLISRLTVQSNGESPKLARFSRCNLKPRPAIADEDRELDQRFGAYWLRIDESDLSRCALNLYLDESSNSPLARQSSFFSCRFDASEIVCQATGTNLAVIPAVQSGLDQYLNIGPSGTTLTRASHGNSRSYGTNFLGLIPLQGRDFRLIGRVWANSEHSWHIRGKAIDVYGSRTPEQGGDGSGYLPAQLAVIGQAGSGADKTQLLSPQSRSKSLAWVLDMKIDDAELFHAIEPGIQKILPY